MRLKSLMIFLFLNILFFSCKSEIINQESAEITVSEYLSLLGEERYDKARTLEIPEKQISYFFKEASLRINDYHIIQSKDINSYNSLVDFKLSFSANQADFQQEFYFRLKKMRNKYYISELGKKEK